MGRILSKQEFLPIGEGLKNEGKRIVLCHGVFDLVHPGHLIHLEEAKSLGDVLVVSVTAARFVRKGPGRPFFDDELRLKFLSSLEPVDFVLLSESDTVEDIVELVKPSFYVKGEEYATTEDLTGKIGFEAELVKKYGGDLYFTKGQCFSSTKLINNALPALTPEVKAFLNRLREQYSFEKIKGYVDKMKGLSLLVVGDIIIDEYVYCKLQGLMHKDTGYSARYVDSEQFLGGALAIAGHAAEFSENVSLLSVVGTESPLHSLILNGLSNKMRVLLESGEQYQSIVKKRFIVRNEKRAELNKIFSINNLPTDPRIDEGLMRRFKSRLNDIISGFDAVLLADFGHGLIDREVMEIIQKKAKFLALNCQTNSSNAGLNLITKYHRADTFVLDQKELRLAFGDYSLGEREGLLKLQAHFKTKGWLTQGSLGTTAVDEDGELLHCPAFTLNVVDTIGAGDAFYTLAALSTLSGVPVLPGTFLANVAGALATNFVGNKESVGRVDLLKYANTLMKG